MKDKQNKTKQNKTNKKRNTENLKVECMQNSFRGTDKIPINNSIRTRIYQ